MTKKSSDLIEILIFLEKLIEERKNFNNKTSYTKKLLEGNHKKIVQKVAEESAEVVIEATLKDKEKTIYESADLIYHLLVMWNKLDISLSDIARELKKRNQ